MATGIDPNDLYNDFIATVNTFQGGFYPPASVFIRVANDVSIEMWEEKTAVAENNQKNQDDLYVFLRTKNCIVVATNTNYGMTNYPEDYGAYSSARVVLFQGKFVGYEDCETCGSKPDQDEEERYQQVQRYLDGLVEHDVKKINNSKWGNCLSSETKPPTFEKPKITQVNKGFKVAPRGIPVIVLDYYINPAAATFEFTKVPGNPQTGAGDQIIYNKNTSVPFQWNKNVINEFLWRLGERFGIYTRDQFLAQYSNQKQKEK